MVFFCVYNIYMCVCVCIWPAMLQSYIVFLQADINQPDNQSKDDNMVHLEFAGHDSDGEDDPTIQVENQPDDTTLQEPTEIRTPSLRSLSPNKEQSLSPNKEQPDMEQVWIQVQDDQADQGDICIPLLTI